MASLSKLCNFDFTTNMLGLLLSGSVNSRIQSLLVKMLDVAEVNSLVFVRQLMRLVCKRSSESQSGDDQNVQYDGLTDEEINQISDEEVEAFAKEFITHNVWLLVSYEDRKRIVEHNENGEKVVSYRPKHIDLPKEDAESNCDYLTRVFSHYFALKREKGKKTVETAIGRMAAGLNKFIESSITAAAMDSYLRHQELLRTVDPYMEMKRHLQGSILSQPQVQDQMRLASSHQAYSTQQAKSLSCNEGYLNSAAQHPALQGSLVTEIMEHQRRDAFLKTSLADFRIPQPYETAQLINEYQLGSVASFAKNHSLFVPGQQSVFDSITTPWLHTDHTNRSITGILELYGLSSALRTGNGFSSEFTDALRQDLGDWRDKITFPEAIFSDPVARTAFYVDRGFNLALTDFPEPAFHQVLEHSGLDDIDLEQFKTAPVKQDDLEESGQQRANKCFDHIRRFERQLRGFIDKEMTRQYGSNWQKKRLQPKQFENWQAKKQQAESNGEINTLIEMADFTDYELIICKQDNWREVFQTRFITKESVRESLQRLYPIRRATMHSRIVTKEDELYLVAEVTRLTRAFKISP
ncbi:MAG: Swt1 family HEPN domain-containing protein [Desulfuromonadaceae bacterium]